MQSVVLQWDFRFSAAPYQGYGVLDDNPVVQWDPFHSIYSLVHCLTVCVC
jgi:hypothetical protein